MSKDIVIAVQGPFQHAFGLLQRFIEICPEKIWEENFGGWPVWQQIYHAVSALDFFIAAPGSMPAPRLADAAVGRLESQGAEALSQKTLVELAVAAKLRVENYLGALTDAQLAQKNEGLSQRMRADISHGATLGMLASHTLYHLGGGDAALRSHGLKGVF